MHDDAEALVDGLLGGDAQDAGELVAQWAAAIGLDVGGGQSEAGALARQERRERMLLARGDGVGDGELVASGGIAVAGLAAQRERAVERGRLEDLPLEWRGGGKQAGIDVGERLGKVLPGGTLR